MLRIAIKILLLYLLWALIIKPAYLSVRGGTSDAFGAVKKVYWWMSPGSNGWFQP